MKFSILSVSISLLVSVNLHASIGSQSNAEGFSAKLTEAKQILGFCQQYTNEFATLVKSCSKYSDRAVEGLTTVTNDICISLKNKIADFESFLGSSECHSRSPNVFTEMSRNLGNLQTAMADARQKITQYKASLLNIENVPFTGSLSREILIVWAMEVTNKYNQCPIQTLGESDVKFFGQSNDATKIYFRWKQALMGTNRLENEILARETTAKTKIERDHIAEIRKIMSGTGLALEIGPNGLRTTNNRISWSIWLNSRTSDVMNQGRSTLSVAAQNAWLQQSRRGFLLNVSGALAAEAAELMDQSRNRSTEVLKLCKGRPQNLEYYDEGEADDGIWH
jgi:hypothetical protein